MTKLIFATTNKGKLSEAQEILNIEIIGSPLEIDEIQSLDTSEVAVKKAQAYFEVLKKPLFIEDVALTFEAISPLPGTYINDFSKVFGNEGLCQLLLGKSKKAIAKTTIVYVDKKGQSHEFVGEVKGTIAEKPRGDKGFGWDPIFIPSKSDKTFAEMQNLEKNKYSMRRIALIGLSSWLSRHA